MIDRRTAQRLRRGWRPIEVPETAPCDVPGLPTLAALQFNSAKLMRMVDALPPALREVVHAHDWQTVAAQYPEIVRQAWWKAAEDNWGRGA